MCVENVFHRAASEAVSHQRSQHDWCSPLSNKKLAPLSVRRCSSINSIVIGSGCNSVVFKCTDAKTGETFAVKEPRSPMSKDACRSPQGQKDSRMLQDLRHENVVEHRRGCEDGSMVLEYLDGGSLLSVMERAGGCLDEEQVSSLTRQILKGVSYIHSKGIIHMDIKPANIFFDSTNNVAKVGDIAVASEATSCHRSSGVIVPVGTPAFLAPEVVQTSKHSFASDIWAVGCSVLQLVAGRVPWDEEDSSFSALFKIGHGQHPPIPAHFSARLRSFLSLCFQPVDLRPSASALLSHPFLNTPAHSPPAGPDSA